MKHNDIMPECYIDTTLVSSLLEAKVCHKHNCNEVAKEMKSGKYKDAFAIGIIDNDKRELSYSEEFEEIGRTDNLTFLKHRKKHQYLIKVGKKHKAMETFITENVSALGLKMEDFGLPSNLDKLIEVTKDCISTQKDPRILKLCKTLQQSPEVGKLKNVLDYLATNKYQANEDTVKAMIKGCHD